VIETFVFILIVMVLFIYFVRLFTIYKYRVRALKYTTEKCLEAIENGDYKYERFFEDFDNHGSYYKMMFVDLWKWTYNDFYPNYE